MRQVATIATERDAQRFADYLLTLGVPARVDAGASGHTIWVFEENDIDRAKAAFDEFNRDPNLPKFVEAQPAAAKLRQEKIDSRKPQSNVIELRERWQAPLSRRAPLTMFLIVTSVVITIASEFGKRADVADWVAISNVSRELPEVQQGELWRLITPIFLHLSWLHLIFNMYWLYLLGSMIEMRRSTLVLGALVVTSGVVSCLAQNYADGPNFGGMSGVVYALFGYCWMKSRFDSRLGIYVDPQTVLMMIAWLVLCQAKMVGPVANTAHIAGLAVGLVSGYAPTLLKR
jgi:GlpG protein